MDALHSAVLNAEPHKQCMLFFWINLILEMYRMVQYGLELSHSGTRPLASAERNFEDSTLDQEMLMVFFSGVVRRLL
jgi:hypothetical protein